MTPSNRNTFSKAERITAKRLVDRLFAGGNPSMAAFPLRAVYMPLPPDSEWIPAEAADVSVLVSVPKRRLHHAVDRNRMKRQIREAYRLNKHSLLSLMAERRCRLAVAFVCISDKPCATPQVEHAMQRILRRIGEQADTLAAAARATSSAASSATSSALPS